MFDFPASFSILLRGSVWARVLGGVGFTLIISVISVTLGLIFGSVFAMVRNYCTKGSARIFQVISVAYIELFRNTPLLLWVFICFVFCPVPGVFSNPMLGLTSAETKILFRSSVALILFTSSVIAEIVRGGLNAVAHGQFEAAQSQGFKTVQIMRYIVLPQAYRAIVPTLLSQVITTVKDSSYIANVAMIEVMARIRQLVTTSNRYNGTGTQLVSDVFVLFGLAFLIYFIINFSLSCVVRGFQKKNNGNQSVEAA